MRPTVKGASCLSERIRGDLSVWPAMTKLLATLIQVSCRATSNEALAITIPVTKL
jgi:hypothetical protein